MNNAICYKVKKSIALISILFSGLACAGSAPSVITFEEGEQFNLSLSRINLNRIFVEGENIVKLSYPEKTFTIEKCEQDASDCTYDSIYLKPVYEVPVTLFLTTDKGRHLSLTIAPNDTDGKTLKLVAKPQSRLKYVKSDTHDVSEVDEVMAAMKAGATPEEFNEKRVNPSPFYIKKNIRVTLEKQYQGTRLTGYVYRLENKSNHEIALTTDLFSHKNAASLSLSDEALAPNKIAYLYGLYSNQG